MTIRLAAVRNTSAAPPGNRAARAAADRRLAGRLPARDDVCRRHRPGDGVGPRRAPGCATINREASRWTPVRGLRGIALAGSVFGARTAVGAAQEIACSRSIRSVSDLAAERFLNAVDRRFAGGAAGPVEGFFATWSKDAAGNAKVCVFVRGVRGGTGDVSIAGTTRPSGSMTRAASRGSTRRCPGRASTRSSCAGARPTARSARARAACASRPAPAAATIRPSRTQRAGSCS